MDDRPDWVERAHELEAAGERVAVWDLPPGTSGTAAEPGEPTGTSGSTYPLLVLHGFPTSSIDFVRVLEALNAERRVVLLDYPGFGLSVKPDRAYSLFEQADVVESVAQQLSLEDVDLLTHDMGDSIGGELLARSLDGDLNFGVRRRVITNGSIYLARAQLTDGQQFLRALPDELLPEDTAPDQRALTDALADLVAPGLQGNPVIVAALRESAGLICHGGGDRLLARTIRYVDERSVHESRWTGAIETHSAPLTILWGRHDPIAVAGMASTLHQRRPDSQLVWLDAGHWPMIERPTEFATALRQALA